MPYVKRTFYKMEERIMAFSLENSAAQNVSITNTYIQFNADGDREVPGGMFIGELNGEFRYLPRFTLSAATDVASAVVSGSPVLQMVAGDVLHSVHPFGSVVIGGTPAATDTVTVTINGSDVVYTVVGSPSVNDVAVDVAAAINSDYFTRGLVEAVAGLDTVYIFAKDGLTSYSLAAAVTGTVTATASGASLVPGAALGTIQSVDVAAGTVTLTANAAFVLPAGARVGLRVDRVVGIDICQRNYDTQINQSVAAYTASNGCDTDNLPYFDPNIESQLPLIYFNAKF